MGYDMFTDMANLGYMWGAKIPSWGLAPLPIAPSKMNPGSNFGKFDASKWNNWGKESLVRVGDDFVEKVPKSKTQQNWLLGTDVETFPNFGRGYRKAVNEKLAANRIPGFEPYNYVGYYTTDNGYLPVFRQKKLNTKGMLTQEGVKFNEEAYNDIVSELNKYPNLKGKISDYDLGHNIGKNEEGVGKLFDAFYESKDLLNWFERMFPRNWEFNPIGASRILTNQINNYAEE